MYLEAEMVVHFQQTNKFLFMSCLNFGLPGCRGLKSRPTAGSIWLYQDSLGGSALLSWMYV